MSQRCLISFRKNVTDEDRFYDCIYDENADLKILLTDWLSYEDGMCIGPWKLNIKDKELFENFMKDFRSIKHYVPQLSSLKDIWGIYIDGVCIQDNPPKWLTAVLSNINKI